MADIFISYAREDRATAESVAALLESSGWSVWADWHIRGGERYRSVIEREIGDALCIVALWSRISIEARWVLEEAEVGAERGVLIPCLIEQLERLPLGFRAIQTVDLTSWNRESSHPGIEQLIRDCSNFAPIPGPENPSPPRSDVSRLQGAELDQGGPGFHLRAEALGTTEPLKFVGRESELAVLRDAWERAAAGDRQSVLIAGEPGKGKSALALAFAREAVESGGRALLGRSPQGGAPYESFVDPLNQFLSQVNAEKGPDAVRNLLGRSVGELARLVPDLAARVPGIALPTASADPMTERAQLFNAVASWLAAASAEAPVLLVLDDLQWAGADAIALLLRILTSPENLRLLVIGAYRDTHVQPGTPFAAALDDLVRVGARILNLDGLDMSAIEQLVRAAGLEGAGGPSRLAAVLGDKTGGLPIWVSLVMRHLAEQGGPTDGSTTSDPVDDLDIPELPIMIRGWMTALSQSAQDTLTLASVIGLAFQMLVLKAVAEAEPIELEDQLQEAVSAKLITRDASIASGSEYHFAHALVQHCLYDEFATRPLRLATIHRRIGEALVASHGSVDLLAHHFIEAAADGDCRPAIHHAILAGRLALEQHANARAVEYFAKALELAGTQPGELSETARCDLLIDLGEAQRRRGDPSFRGNLLEAARGARETSDGDRFARAVLANHRGFISHVGGVVDEERIALLEEALELVPPKSTSLKARLQATLALELHFSQDSARREDLLTEAIDSSRAMGDRELLAYVLAMATGDNSRWTHDQGAAILDELAAIAEHDPHLRFVAAYEGEHFRLDFGDADLARADAATAVALAEELGEPSMRWRAAGLTIGLHLLDGKLAEAEAMANTNLGVGNEAGEPDAFDMWVGQIFCIRLAQGRLGELLPALDQGEQQEPDQPQWRIARVIAHCEEPNNDERHAEIRAILDSYSAEDVDGLSVHPRAHLGWAALTWAVARLNEPEYATRFDLQRRLEEIPQRVISLTGCCIVSVAFCLGRLHAALGNFPEADRYFQEAEQLENEMGRPPILSARTDLEIGRMLLERGPDRKVEAVRRLTAAQTVSKANSMQALEREASSLLSGALAG